MADWSMASNNVHFFKQTKSTTHCNSRFLYARHKESVRSFINILEMCQV